VADLERQQRLQIMLTSEELTALEDFRFDHRMPSRAAAVRELLRRGLAAEGKLKHSSGLKSGEYGVLEKNLDESETGAG
jgi:metal-responsive CopG/Arc/MetJ family transcriptional regulator